MKKHLLLAGAVALTLALLPRGADAQGVNLGATVAPGGACPSTAVLSTGTGRYVYATNTGWLCVSGSFSAAATAPYVLTSTGFQVLSVSSSAVGFTPPATSTVCFILTETQAVRYRTDGTSPTASVGVPLAVSTQLTLTASLSSVKFIAQTGTASLDIDCYK